MRVSPEVVEYPDLKQGTARSRHLSTKGAELFVIHDEVVQQRRTA
jgi:hypothetical protein